MYFFIIAKRSYQFIHKSQRATSFQARLYYVRHYMRNCPPTNARIKSRRRSNNVFGERSVECKRIYSQVKGPVRQYNTAFVLEFRNQFQLSYSRSAE